MDELRPTPMPTPCIETDWTRNAQGYGYKTIQGRTARAHRYAWEQANGPIPDGLFVCHACDNPPCINVDHLWLGTNADNSRDRHEKGRDWEQRKTHCDNGHPFDEANTLIRRSGRDAGNRHCRACRRERWWAAERAKWLVTAPVRYCVACGTQIEDWSRHYRTKLHRAILESGS